MKGQVWQEYVMVLAGIVLLGVVATAYLYGPTTRAIACATAYMRAQSEIARQEFNTLNDFSIYGFRCDLESTPKTVDIMCTCSDPGAVGGAVNEVLSKLGITANINVTQVS